MSWVAQLSEVQIPMLYVEANEGNLGAVANLSQGIQLVRRDDAVALNDLVMWSTTPVRNVNGPTQTWVLRITGTNTYVGIAGGFMDAVTDTTAALQFANEFWCYRFEQLVTLWPVERVQVA